jgi:hypothetical protein
MHLSASDRSRDLVQGFNPKAHLRRDAGMTLPTSNARRRRRKLK